MARSLGQLTVDLALKTGSFETDAGRAAKIAEKRAKEIDAAFAKAGAAIGATIAAGVTTASVAIKSAINSMDDMSKAAARVQMPTEEFSKLAYAGDLADVSIQDLQSSLGKLSKSAAAALKDTSEQAKVFQALGISVTDASGKLRSSSDLLMDFADAFKAMGDRPEAMAAGMSLFGKSFQTMIPLIKDGSAGLREAGDEAERLGMVLSTEAGRQAEAFNDNITRMQSAVSGLARTVAAELLPDMVRASEEVATWAKEAGNAERIANSLSNTMQAAGAIIDFAIITPFRVAGDVIEGATTATIGLMEALKGLASMDLSQIRAGFNVWKEGAGLAIFGSERMDGKPAAPNAAPTVKMITGRELLAQDAARLQQAVADAKKAEEFAAKLRAALGGTDKPPKPPKSPGKTKADDGARQMEEAAKAAQQLSEAQDNARRTLEDWRAELDGPAAQALLKYSRMERELDEQVAAGEITWKQYADAMGMVSDMRARDEALMTDQQKAAKALAEAQADAAAEYERTWRGAIEGVGYAFADFITGGISSFKDFGRALKDIAKRFMADMIGQFANNALQNTIGDWFRGITSGGFSQAGGQGGWMQMIQGMFGGKGGGQGIMGGISNWLGGLFGGGSSAAAGSMYGFGNVGNLAGVAGASSSLGGSAAAAGGGAGTGAMSGIASVPVVGWIIAGMMANSAMWDKGWDIANGESWLGKIATAGAVGTADKAFRKLGLDDKTASILSGSSIHAALFGRKKPEIRGQGLQGSFGFGGLDARMFADIIEKGGVFRSDKKYTRYGTVDSDIDREFDKAARQVNSGATALAKQLGMDISQQLAGVKIDLGKVKLDKDPEKAQAQLEKLLSDMVERLAAETVKAAGFQHLLDDGFAATDMMNALGTSIQLVTGGAEKLGRALTDWERSNVTKAVEWFEQLANVNGTEIAAEIERVVGTLRSYSDLMTGVETQLLTAGLNEYQRAQLDIEMGYRDQVKQANELAKSLGLTGARAEDLAKIEQLRAVNMAALQKQMEAQKNTFLEDLGLSDLSPMRDSEKLAESMQLLRDAVGAGDLQRAQQLSQQVLGFGRNLYASGADYNGLYGEVTGLLGGMTPGALEGFTETGLDNIADILEGLPDKFAQALFMQAANINPVPPPPVSTGTPPPTPITTTQPGTGGTEETNTLLRLLLAAVQRQGALLEMDSLNTRVNAL